MSEQAPLKRLGINLSSLRENAEGLRHNAAIFRDLNQRSREQQLNDSACNLCDAADEIERLQGEVRIWMDATNEWIKANGPGGWIDDLRQRASGEPTPPSKEQLKHERRIVQHASGWQEKMNTCVCGRKWPCLLDRLRADRDIVDHSANNGRRRVKAPKNETDAADEIERLQSDNEATRDMLTDARLELDALRAALGVDYEPHQSLQERMLDAANQKRVERTAPEPPADCQHEEAAIVCAKCGIVMCEPRNTPPPLPVLGQWASWLERELGFQVGLEVIRIRKEHVRNLIATLRTALTPPPQTKAGEQS